MKFKTYLNEEIVLHEDNILEYIEKNCKLFLVQSKGEYVYRGIEKVQDDYIIKKPRTNRLPISVPEQIHKILDKIFKDMFGWKARSTGVFATGRESNARIYGKIFLFFPIGNFQFIWSPKIHDLFTRFHEVIKKHVVKDFDYLQALKTGGTWLDKNEYKEAEKNAQEFIKKNKYNAKNLFAAIKSGNEIMFKCDKYLAVRANSDMAKEIDTVYGK